MPRPFSSDRTPGLEVPLGDRAAAGAARGSSGAFLLVGGLGTGTVALGPGGGFLPFRGWLRSRSARHEQKGEPRTVPRGSRRGA